MRRILNTLFDHLPQPSRGRALVRKRTPARLGLESLEDRLALDGRAPVGATAVPAPVRTQVQLILPPPGGEKFVIVAPRGGLGSNPNPDDPDEPSGPGAPVIHVPGIAAVERALAGLDAVGGTFSAYPNPEDDGSGPTFPPGWVGPNPGPVWRFAQIAALRQLVNADPRPEPWTPGEVPDIGQQAGF